MAHSEAARLVELLEDVLPIDWADGTDDVQTSADNPSLGFGERILSAWTMASLPRSPFLLEAQSLRKEGDNAETDLELSLTNTKDNVQVVSGRGAGMEAATEALLRALALKIYELQRAQRLLEMLATLDLPHTGLHNRFDY